MMPRPSTTKDGRVSLHGAALLESATAAQGDGTSVVSENTERSSR